MSLSRPFLTVVITTMILLFEGVAFASDSDLKGEIYVATKQVQMKTKTFLFKFPVEAQRGERWEIVKWSKSKVVLTFGPKDSRREAFQRAGLKKQFEYEVDGATFAAGFVAESKWPETRKTLAAELKKRFESLTLKESERAIDGEVWVGMKKELALEAIDGNRIFKKESRETKDGASEIWHIGGASISTTGQISGKSHMIDEVFSSPSRPAEPLETKMNREMEASIVMVLNFKNGELSEVVRRH